MVSAVLKTWLKSVLIAVCIFVFFVVVTPSKDDSDPKQGRSGLIPYTDHLTGCQYLSRPGLSAALSPRLDRNGNHICKDAK